MRDRIPEVMAIAGISGQFRVAKRAERLQLLLSKLIEESIELELDPSISELVDVVEVLAAIKQELGLSNRSIEAERMEKRTVKGGYETGVVLSLGDPHS